MRLFLHAALWFLALSFLCPARAETTPDPLRLVPEAADVFVRIESPRKLLDAVYSNDILNRLRNLEAVREYYDSTNFRRFQQLLGYFEKNLGVDRMEMLERLTAGGIVVAAKIGPQPAPTLLVVQGKDEALLQRFVNTSFQVVEQELARQESKDRLTKSSYRGIAIIGIGKQQFFMATAGSALLIANMEKALQLGIDQHFDGTKKSLADSPRVALAKKLLDPEPAAWLFVNMDTVHKAPQAKEVFTLPRNDVNLTVLFGGLLDVAQRSAFLCAGLCPHDDGFLLSFRLPAGREGMPRALSVHVPLDQSGPRPLLEPKGVLYSSSYYFDLAKFWEHRDKLFNAKQVKSFEAFDKTSRNFLAGSEFSKLIAQAGAYQRIVVAPQVKTAYKIVPELRLPAFAFVLEMREPESFSKKMIAILRSAALLATTQVRLKPTEEKIGERMLLTYRFPEDGKLEGDTGNMRFNFSPSFVAVGNQFIASSTVELCRELVELIDKETAANSGRGGTVSIRSQLYAVNGATVLETIMELLFAQAMLSQALSPVKAGEEVKEIIDLVRRLGVLQFHTDYGPRDFRFEVRLKYASK